MIKRFFLTFLIATSLCYSQGTTTSTKEDSPYSTSINLNIKKQDLDAAKELAKLKYQVNSNSAKLELAKSTLKAIKSRKIFSHFIPWNESVIKVLSENKAAKHFKLCQVIDSELTRFCLETFFDKYSKTDLSHYFDSSTSFILSNMKAKTLSNFLKNAKEIKKISQSFLNEFKSDPKLMNRLIIQNLYHSKELTLLVQKSKFFESNYIFKKLVRTKINDIYLRLDENKEYKEKLTELLQYTKDIHQDVNTQIIYKSLFVMGKTFSQKKDFKSARIVFSTLMDLGLGSRSSLYFESMWSYILEGKLDDAFEIYAEDEAILSEMKSFEDDRINFWLAHLYGENGKESKAHELYKKIIYDSPLSYYSIMSAKKLSKSKDVDFTDSYLSNLKNKELKTNPIITYHEDETDKLLRIKIWDKIRARQLLRKEKNLYLKGGFTNPYLKISKFFYDDGNYLEGFKSIYRGINVNVETLNPLSLTYLYPTQYLDRLQKVSSDFDPIIALSLIRQESAFNERARSHVGARGLMQIMPNTGKRFHRSLRTHQLYNPKVNIKIGTKYLKKLLNRYDDNLVYTLAAYNAGESRVKRWKRDLFNDDSILENIEKIPFLETRKYVKLIFRNIFFYKLLNKNQKASRALASNDQNYLYDVYLGF